MDLGTILAWALPAVTLVAVGGVLVARRRYSVTTKPVVETVKRPVTDSEVRLDEQPLRVNQDPVEAALATKSLDYFILRHIEDQRRMPVSQRFLDADRRHNAILNRWAVGLLGAEGIEMAVPGSALSESHRPPDASHYLPRYFPDDVFDSALAMYKHELIAHRLIGTIAKLHLIRDGGAVPLANMAALRSGYTPFIPDAYVSFYNDIVAGADDLDREDGIREEMRALVLRVVFPIETKEVDYWRKRGFDVYQAPIPAVRKLLNEWFHLTPADFPLAP